MGFEPMKMGVLCWEDPGRSFSRSSRGLSWSEGKCCSRLLHVEENISKMAELLSVFDWVIALYLMGFRPILSGLHHVLGLGLIFGPGDDSFQ